MTVILGIRLGWLVKVFSQKEGIDYNEIFSPVVKLTTIRIVSSLVIAENLQLEQMDVKLHFHVVILRRNYI